MVQEKKTVGEIRVAAMVLGEVATNCYALYREAADGEKTPAILIDPPDNGSEIYEKLAGRGMVIEKILLTHAHFDHIGGIAGVNDGTITGCVNSAKVNTTYDEQTFSNNQLFIQ